MSADLLPPPNKSMRRSKLRHFNARPCLVSLPLRMVWLTLFIGMSFVPTIHRTPYPYINPSKYSMQGKSALITGASKGCGRAFAIGYAKAGISQLVLAARSDVPTKEILEAAKSAGRPEPKILTLKLDVTSRSDVEAAAELVEKHFGGLDVLINNAGYLGRFKPIVDSDPDDWWNNWETNIKGIFLMSRSFIPLILKSELKTIINIASEGAHVLLKGASGYMTTKLANLRLSQFLNLEYGGEGLLAYSVNPGGIHTDLAHNMPDWTWGPILTDDPELCGETVPWLTSVRREWLAGRYVSCPWDMRELEERREEVVKYDLLKVRLAIAPEQ